jgi:hypothetical protein
MNRKALFQKIVCLSIFLFSSLFLISGYYRNAQAETTVTGIQKTIPTLVSAETGAQSLAAIQNASRDIDGATKSKVLETYSKLPIYFIANQGQTDEKVRYYIKGSGYSFFFTKDEVVYSFVLRDKKAHDIKDARIQKVSLTKGNDEAVKAQVIKLRFIGANPDVEIKGSKQEDAKVNYFIGKDSSRWQTNIPTYSEITYKDIYKGIDLVYKGSPGKLKSEFVVRPGANPKDIKLAYNDVDSMSVSDAGDLIIRTALGEMKEEKPHIYQVIDGKEIELKGQFNIESIESNNHSYSFSVDSYNTSQPLIIDPALSYSTFLGGSSAEDGWRIAVDSSGSAYVTGSTTSDNFPTGPYAPPCLTFDCSHNGSGSEDAFITKLNAAGNALVYSTFLGGSSEDRGSDIKVDSSGNVYVAGSTYSSDFPTWNPSQGSNAGAYDAFVSKLNTSGNALVYSTYLGGSNYDYADGLAVDGIGDVYITGYTYGSFPTINAYQGTFGGAPTDAFIAKFHYDPIETTLLRVYSTYLGGNNRDEGSDIAVDNSGNVYVTGETSSGNFPLLNAFQNSNNGGYDAFVTKVNAAGNALVYSTFLGGE